MLSIKRLIALVFFLCGLGILSSLYPGSVKAVDGEITYSGIQTGIYGDDSHTGGQKGPFNIGFPFTFYGTEYTQVNISINGVLTFGPYYTAYTNGPLASTGQNNSIYAFWDDLNTLGSQIIYYSTVGEAPNRKFVVQWTNIYFHGTTVQLGTFQVVLYEGSNRVQLQYRDLLGGERALGNSATIGMKRDNSVYEQFSNETASLTPGQVLRYTPNGSADYTVQSSVPGVGEEVGALYDFIYLSPPGAPVSPTLVNPTNGTTGTTPTPTFEWLPVEGATSYTLLVSTVSNFSSTVVNQSGISGTSYTLGSSLNTGTQYYWRVQSVNGSGSSLSSTRTFTTGAANIAPNLPSGISSTLIEGSSLESVIGQTLTTTLSDNDADEQVRYRIQIATSNDFSELVVDYRSAFGAEGEVTYTVGQTGGTYLVGNSETSFPPDQYYLRIRTEDDAAASSSWSTVSGVAFTVLADETAPEIVDIESVPASNSATISWNTTEASSSLVEYGLLPSYELSTSEQNTSPRVSSHSVELSNLKPCARYFYRVKSKDAAANEAVSSQQGFTTTGCVVSSVVEGSEEEIPSSGGSLEQGSSSSTVQLSFPESFYTGQVRVQLNRLASEAAPVAPGSKQLIDNNFFDLLAVNEEDEVIEEFNAPVTFTITYDASLEETYDESTLDIYRYESGEWVAKNCVVDTEENTVTCSLSGFSVYALFGAEHAEEPEPEEPGEDSDESESVSEKHVSQKKDHCSLLAPSSAPSIYQADFTGSEATLYFVPASGSVTGYVIEYQGSKSSDKHAVTFSHSDKSGAVSYVIRELGSSPEWKFRIQARNGCKGGEWSKTFVVGKTATAVEPLAFRELDGAASPMPPQQEPPKLSDDTQKEQQNDQEASSSAETLNTQQAFSWPKIQVPQVSWPKLQLPTPPSFDLRIASPNFSGMIASLDTGIQNARHSVYLAAQPVQTALANTSSKVGKNTAATIDLWLDSHPTTITGLQVQEVGTDYAIITWETNHYSTSKVSYGDSHDYGQDVQDTEKVRFHEMKVTGLEPGRTYYYEVMSHGNTYAYDARHEFSTQK